MTIDSYYYDLLRSIMEFGYETPSRTEGVSRKTIAFPERLEFPMHRGFAPAIRVKPVSFNNVVTELLWFLRGNDNILYLLENDNHIWTSDCFRYQSDLAYRSNDQEFLGLFPQKRVEEAKEEFRTTRKFSKAKAILKEFEAFVKHKPYYGQTGNTYPIFWHKFAKSLSFDTLVPENTRLVMSSWQDSSVDNSALPPCHYSMQIIVTPDGYFDLAWNQRSVDVVLGLPYNVLSYAVFMELVGKRFRLKPNTLYANLGHTHVYSNHYDAVYEMFARYDGGAERGDVDYTASERIAIDGIKDLWEYNASDIMLVDYNPMPKLSHATPMVGGIV